MDPILMEKTELRLKNQTIYRNLVIFISFSDTSHLNISDSNI